MIFTPLISSGNDSAKGTTTASALMLIVVIPRLVVYPFSPDVQASGRGPQEDSPYLKTVIIITSSECHCHEIATRLRLLSLEKTATEKRQESEV